MEYTEGRVEVGDREFRYLEAGEGEPLVWLHGGGGLYPSRGTDLLAEQFRLVALELPGFGSSWDLVGAETFDQLGAQVGDAIEAMELGDHVLHGTSFGGAVALHLALDRPHGITRLILESPAAFRPVGWVPPDIDTVRKGLFRHPELARRVRIDPKIALRDRELVNRLSLTVDRDALAGRLRDLSVPTLVIFGEADTLVPPAMASNYCDNAPECSLLLIPDAAHVVSSDQPEIYAAAVSGFARDGTIPA